MKRARPWLEDLFAAACWLVTFAAFSVLAVGVSG